MNKIEKLIQTHCSSGVEFKALKDVFDIKNGYTPSKANSKYWDNGSIPWFRMEDIRKNGRILSDSIQHITPQAVKGGRLFPANSIIIATTATIGEHALITVDSLANQRFTFLSKKLNCCEVINMKFFFYYCYVLCEWCKNNTNSASFPSVRMPEFRKIKIPIPPLAVQKEIVTILDNFTQLEAELEAELEARKKQYEYYRQQLLSFNTAGGGYVQWIKLMNIASYSKNRISANKLNAETYVGVDNLLQNKQGKTLSAHVPTTGNLIEYKVGDILVGNIRPYLKKIWQATNTGGANGDVLVVQINENKEDNVAPRFLYHLLASDNFFNYNMRFAKGAKMPRGDKPSIMNFKIPIPPLSEQQRIVAILDKFDALVNDISTGLPAEITARKKQYEYYRNQLLTFEPLEKHCA